MSKDAHSYSFINKTDITTFINTYTGTPQGTFGDVQILLDDAFESDTQIVTLSEANLDAMEDYIASSDTSFLSTIGSNEVQIASLLPTYESNQSALIAQADSLLGTVEMTIAIEQDYQTAYATLIDYLQTDTVSNINTLNLLADECPTEFPRSVSIARALLTRGQAKGWNTYSDCGSGGSKLKFLESTTDQAYSEQTLADPMYIEKITLFPNPVQDVLSLSRAVEEIAIVDARGVTVMRKGFTSSQISVAALPAGLYMAVLRQGDQVQTYRFIKQ